MNLSIYTSILFFYVLMPSLFFLCFFEHPHIHVKISYTYNRMQVNNINIKKENMAKRKDEISSLNS